MGASASSSSSSSSLPPKKYDVFINFRGEDTRSNFTSHLHYALCQNSIRTFIDYELHRGDEIKQSLIQAIRDSSISLVVFSKNYASSRWCLDELIQILQCRKYHEQVVIPVFYKVDPSDVRKQNGAYKEAFTKHERDFIHDQHMVNGWRDALFEATNLAGLDSESYVNECELIQNIVNDVLENLNLQYPSTLRGLVGIDENCKNIEQLLKEAPIIGVWGMGGIGKTTMAKVVFAKLSSQYESCCFLENLREEEEKHGLTYIRDKLLSELLKEKNLYDSTPKVVGCKYATRRLSSKKVLIVLDDVNNSKQLEYLTQEYNFLGPNSRVIITTRDKHLLVGRANKIYAARTLNYEESLKLFSFKAFHKDHLEIGYEQLSERAINYAQGIPLALTVLGSFLYSKTIEEWDSAMKKLEKSPHEDIQEVLKLSYNGLNYEEREMFLDIACFLKGESEEDVITLLESYGFHAKIGLRTLEDRALITITDRVWMHHLMQKMGREIVRQECFKEPGKRSRLWDSEEVFDVLENNRGTDAIEGIMLNVSQIRDVNLSADTFKKMTSLRFLKFYFSEYERSCNINFPLGLESFPNRLKYLHWYGYPLGSLPSTFCPQKLIELNMVNNHVKKLWDGVQDVVNLKRINLMGSKQLMELPDLSKAQKLESMNLSHCENLCNVHPSILSLHTLVFLDLNRCISLKSLKSENHLKSLGHLDISECYNLQEFSLSSEELTQLWLLGTRIEVLHSSIGRLRKLEVLMHFFSSTLKSLPIKELSSLTSLEDLRLENCGEVIDEPNLHILFDGLRSLRCLCLMNCSNLSTIPSNISSLSSLFCLVLHGSSIKNLPASIKYLTNLKKINLIDCRRLQSLPELPSLISSLYAQNCVSLLETVFPSTTSIPRPSKELEFEDYAFMFENCVNLDEHSPIVEYAQLSMKLAVYNCFDEVEIRYPGSRVPEWFGYKQRIETSVTIELAKSLDDLRGFIFCSVISSLTSMKDFRADLFCQCALKKWNYYIGQPKLNSDHVFLWYDSGIKFLNDEKEIKKEVKFEFYFGDYSNGGEVVKYDGLNHLIKACGVYPIYCSEYHNLVQQMQLRTKAKRPRDIDEQEQSLSTKDLVESSKLEHVSPRWELELGTKTKRPRSIIDLSEQEQLPPTKKLKEASSVELVRLEVDLELATKFSTLGIGV